MRKKGASDLFDMCLGDLYYVLSLVINQNMCFRILFLILIYHKYQYSLDSCYF